MKQTTKNLVLSAMFIAIGFVLPFFTGQIQLIGSMLLPMHIPVFLCALICGWQYGLAVGLILPILRSLTMGMPPLFPIAVSMSVEMAVYGLVTGYLYGRSKWKCLIALYRSMIIAMIAGRVAWGFTQMLLLGLSHTAFTWKMFLSGALLNAIPGIIVQLTLIPIIMLALNRTGLVPFHNEKKQMQTAKRE